ncbi:Diacylglycerol acyltransferase - like 6 [Theobroma cacao]|nr:Diacylglycerol acyltransferase - like 4 [Theobroma cacao]WRX20036.1 Diacylglycerol acyltransferase - like 6 [Theobroma cacao]
MATASLCVNGISSVSRRRRIAPCFLRITKRSQSLAVSTERIEKAARLGENIGRIGKKKELTMKEAIEVKPNTYANPQELPEEEEELVKMVETTEDGVDLVMTIKGASFYRRGKHLDCGSDFIPPTPSEFKKIYESHKWILTATSPVMLSTLENGKVVRGLAGIPSEGPVLFPDPSMFDVIRIMGAVPVSATNFYRLLSSKSHVLLYPGGLREALHRKGEEYKLFWPEESEFVRMAARFGAKIVPFGAVGEDDVAEVVLDYNDLVKIPWQRTQIEEMTELSMKLRPDATGEVANQQVYTPWMVPKFPGRFYFFFGKPIETEGR